MQTQLMQPVQPGVPWLERYVANSDAPERTPLQSLPFTIGRIDTADLQIDSTRVSREHAVIVREGDAYRIRDLGSTNGTFVNGERIEETPLHEGDLVVIADCEFTFVAGLPSSSERHRATQAMTEVSRPTIASTHDQVLAIRRLQERLLHRGLLPRLGPIVDLERGAIFAYRAQPREQVERGRGGEAPGAATSGLVLRAQQLYRLLATEAYVNLAKEALLLVDVAPFEAERTVATEAHLRRLHHLAGEGRLIVSLPANSVVDDPRARGLRDRLKQAGLRLAYSDFLGGRAQIEQLADFSPEFLLFDPKVTGDVSGNPRQARQLAILAEACEEIGCRPIVTGLRQREDEEACFKLGLRLVATDRLGRPASTSSLARLFAGAEERVECFA
jgi:EAL domain-containing protein (putative c-di-GMP-specific phosphodiesterase class I)